MYRLSITTLAVALVILGYASSAAAGPPFELSVKREKLMGGSKGTLVFSAEAIEYRTTDTDETRRWAYEDVKQVQVLSPTRIAVLTYEDRGLLTLGADRTFDFTVVQDTVSPGLVTFLLERIPQPVVTAVMPEYRGDALSRVRVKHQRQGRGGEGALVLYDRQLVYVTERAEDSRFWRFGDIYSVLRLDRSRLQITVYEGGGGDTRTFVFALKSDLPDGFYDVLWARVNPSRLPLSSQTSNRLATTARD
jgi:hypothetical protein